MHAWCSGVQRKQEDVITPAFCPKPLSSGGSWELFRPLPLLRAASERFLNYGHYLWHQRCCLPLRDFWSTLLWTITHPFPFPRPGGVEPATPLRDFPTEGESPASYVSQLSLCHYVILVFFKMHYERLWYETAAFKMHLKRAHVQ